MSFSKKINHLKTRRALSLSASALALGMLAQPSAALAQDEEEDVIVVTGTLIRGQAPVGSNQISLSSDALQETASISGNDLLATIPQVTNYFNAVPASDLAIAANQIQISRPNIREISPNNAASSATLILVDGHRIATAGTKTASVDPDLIPVAAIERVEVVTEGGSATYGADAVAGTINFITRRRFDGLKADGSYGIADDYWETSVNAIAGKEWDTGSVYVAYSFSKSDALFGRERDFIRSLDYSAQPYTPLGRECEAPNLSVNYQVFGNTVTSLAAAGPAFIPGVASRCDTSDDTAILPEVERHAGLISFSKDLDANTSIDVKAFYAQRESLATAPITGTAALPANFAVPGTFPAAIPVTIPGFGTFNATQGPATGAFSFTPAIGNAAKRSTIDIKEWGVNAEMRTSVSDNWEIRGLFNYSRSNTFSQIIDRNLTRLNAAGLNGSLDPFNIAATNPAVIADIIDNQIAAEAIDDLINLRLVAEGALFSLPGGDLRLAVGAEYMYEDFMLRQGNDVRLNAFNSIPYDTYTRDVKSVFGEVLIPIFGADNATAGFDTLEISLAGRYDDYEDFGDTFNPKIGVTWKPVNWLTLRGNWGTSFTAPTPIDQLGSNANTINGFQVTPFVRPGETPAAGAFTVALQGSTPNLQPQEAETWSVGFDARPDFIPGLNMSLSYYNVEFENILSTPSVPFDFVAFGNNIQTDPAGISDADLLAFGALAPGGTANVQALINQGANVYALVDFRTGNFGILRVEGLDFNVNYRMDTGFGGFDLGVNGIYQLSRETQASPTAPVQDDLAFDIPELFLRATAGVDIGNFRAQASLNHRGGYDIVPLATDPVQSEVDAFNTVDLFFKYDVDGTGLASDLSFTLNVQNVFDEEPPVFFGNGPNDNGYANGFSVGRMFVIGVSKEF